MEATVFAMKVIYYCFSVMPIFTKEEYEQASSYFSQYLDKVNTQPRKEVQLHIGLSYFYTDRNKEAIISLKEVATDKGELGESASYYLGMLYLKERNLEFASTAFDRARHGTAEQLKSEGTVPVCQGKL